MNTRLVAAAAYALLCSVFVPGNISKPIQQIDLEVINTQPNQIEISWQLNNLQFRKFQHEEYTFSKLIFDNCCYTSELTKPEIPYREFILAIPENAEINFTINDIKYELIENSFPPPVMAASRDKNGISNFQVIIDSIDYSFQPDTPLEISEQLYFRDMPIVRIKFFPISYDNNTKSCKIIRSAQLRFNFIGGKQSGKAFFPQAKIDQLYERMILNFEQAKNWLIEPSSSLRKTLDIPSGPWYRIQVEKDGLYKISKSTLSSAGINVSTIDPRTIKIYNNGGMPLNINTTSEENNPQGPVENAIYVSGESDGNFGDNDFIYFYGKQLGGWNYDKNLKDFRYVQHLYDTKNLYWLTFGDENGKRMQTLSTPTSGATVTDNYFMERLRFEEEKQNLLASGNDWYGHRFFGFDGEVSYDFNFDVWTQGSIPAEVGVKVKSGNGIRWLDPLDNQYWFTLYINSKLIFNNLYLPSKVSKLLSGSFMASEYLVNGSNRVTLQYTSDSEDSDAYLDWLEFYYPRELMAKNNYLMFFTNSVNQIVNYNINGFTNDDIMVFDISEPTGVNILTTNSSVQNGSFSFMLDLSDDYHKRLLISSLQSSDIININKITPYIPKKNLLDLNTGSDLIVITHPSFEDYAQEIVNLRASDSDPLKGTVVNTDDIYLFFSSGVQDVVAIRNFIRFAYNNWTTPKPSYILLFGDGHYDYRNIVIPDTNRIPPFEISADHELDTRETDNFYADINFAATNFRSIQPDLAIGRLPVESSLDAQRMINKLKAYKDEKSHDGWQTILTFVADDEVSGSRTGEWVHQSDTETLVDLPELRKFLRKRIYLSAFNSVPGGFGRVKPEANQNIIDQLNEGTLFINYIGHGSPTEWAHESVLNMNRDKDRIQNENRLTFWVAATCDFGKYDDPTDPSFTEVLLWIESKGAIAVLSSARLVYSSDNIRLNRAFLRNLFPGGSSSVRLGEALLAATRSGANDQKYHLFGDPSMYLADPRSSIDITAIYPDTLRALTKVKVNGYVSQEGESVANESFQGGAFLIVNDAQFDSVNTGGPGYYEQLGPRIFKGEIGVENGLFSGEFIVPKSIRYKNDPTARVTLYAWNESANEDAMGYIDTLTFNGTEQNLSDDSGPDISLYFEGQGNFNEGDLVKRNAILIAELFDENGINLTQEVGHTIEIKVDEETPRDITSFFAYDRDSYSLGKLTYHFDNLIPGNHKLLIQAWDNLNNPSREEINFHVVSSDGLILKDVLNYPNPFAEETNFTFQVQGIGLAAEVRIKIYTISGRLIRTLDNLSPPRLGYNYYAWDARDEDGDQLANGVYLYKVILKTSDEQKEVIEKLVVLR